MPKKLSHLFEYCALCVLQAALSLLPRPAALRLGSLLGTCLHATGVFRRIVRKNLRFVNIWTESEQKEITKKLYRTMGRYAADFLRRTPPLPPHTIRNFELMGPLFDTGKGVIALLAHFGNWELLAAIFGPKIRGLHVVAKPLRNKLVDAWVARRRTAASVEILYAETALRGIARALKENKMVAILIDQNAGAQGTPAPFLGKQTSTIRTVAGLVEKTGCAVLPAYALLRDDGRYDVFMTVAPPIDNTGKSADEMIAAYQAQHNDIVSGWIRERPEHWFGWFHKRFREHVSYNDPD